MQYGAVADAFSINQRASGQAPWVFRTGTPLTVALVARTTGISVDDGFLLVNVLANLLTVALLFWFISGFAQPVYTLVVVSIFVVTWHAPVRFTFFNPVYVDPWFWVIWVTSLIIISEPRAKNSTAGAISLGLLTFFGVQFRETAVLVPSVLLLSSSAVQSQVLASKQHLRQTRKESMTILLAFVGAGSGILLTHSLATNVGAYTFWFQAMDSLFKTAPPRYLLSIFTAFGPALLLLLLKWRPCVQHLINHFEHLCAWDLFLLWRHWGVRIL